MRKIDIVIGNGYGDEGKGSTTDMLCRDRTVVVRFSGGAQAGHTVVTPEGQRHVFSSFGSGAFRGAGTYLSRFFLLDPIKLNQEAKKLIAAGVNLLPAVVDPMAPVVTPFDVLANQLQEKLRNLNVSVKDSRHGSCGYGIGEAAKREEEGPVRLRAQDLLAPKSILSARISSIRFDVLSRLTQLGGRGTTFLTGLYQDLEYAEANFLDALPEFLERVAIRRDDLSGYDHLVFEGSQGLLLDRDIGVFPHVTRSKTGLVNVEKLIGSEISEATVYWISRAYMTRHGAGPLDGELPRPSWVKDPTNVDNEWQGSLRYAPRDEKLLKWARDYALTEISTSPRAEKSVITCCDQLPDDLQDQLPRGELRVYGPTREGFTLQPWRW